MNRNEIEARARAEWRIRHEAARCERLQGELAELRPQASLLRRFAARFAGSSLMGLIAGDRRLSADAHSEAERRAATLRRKRFRLTRRRRLLARGPIPRQHQPAARSAPVRESGRADVPSFCIRIAARDWEAAKRGGDAALARSLARELNRRGHEVVIQTEAEAAGPLDQRLDVVLTLRGRPGAGPVSGRLNLLWLISHPEEADPAEMGGYDRVLVASTQHAAELRTQVGVPVEPLLQFTDPALFHPALDAGPAHDLLFVGNWRGHFRQIVWDAIQAGHPPALYGAGWDLLAPDHAVAEHVPNERLHLLYSSCGLLLCDHWEDMRRHGFVSNRVFDALACGAPVIADDNPGVAAALPGAVETYASPADLREKIDRLLGDPAEARRMAARGRRTVLAEHTADLRAERLIAIAGE